MWKKIIFGLVITGSLIAGFFWYNYTKEVSADIGNALSAIPRDASIVLESKQIIKTWKKISHTNIMWEELLGIDPIQQLNHEITSLDSLFELNPAVMEILEGNSSYISFHTYKNNTQLLFATSLPDLTYQNKIDEFFKSLNKNTETNKHSVNDITIHSLKNKINYYLFNGILVVSNDNQLIESSAKQIITENTLITDPDFKKIFNAAGKKVDANIYVNYKKLATILTPYTASSSLKTINSITNFADYSGWDIDIKPNALSLSGFTQTKDTALNFLACFLNQKPQKIELHKYVPSKASSLLLFGFSNFVSFQKDHKKYLSYSQKKNKRDDYFNSFLTEHGINLEPLFNELVGNEVALIKMGSSNENEPNIALINTSDISTSTKLFLELNDSILKTNNEKIDTLSVRGHTIHNIKIRELIPNLLGESFNSIENCFLTSIENNLVVGNSFESLESYINEVENNKTLTNDKNYQTFIENISEEANIYYYSSIPRSLDLIEELSNNKVAQTFTENEDHLKKFEAVGIQFSNNNQLFYSNIFIKYNPDSKQETGTIWETKIDTTISSKPYLVINHNTKAKELFIQDDANKIYLISNTGKILWTKQLPEKIMSDVTQVDALKNDKLQLIFNTRSYIYMFDRNGNEMKNFPIKLRSPATNSIAIVDYERNEDYRIFIATENKRIVCYKANGEQVTAFKFDKTTDQVFLPIQYFNLPGKDHVCAIDTKGKLYILNRHGEARVKTNERLPQGIRNFFIETGKDYSKSYIIAADTLGNISKISLTGKKETIHLQDFETSPYFDYKDLNNDKIKEFVLLTRNELKVFNQDKSLIYKYEFKSKIDQNPQYFVFPDGTIKIGVTSAESNELFLFENNGSLSNGFPLTGKTQFSIGDLNNESIYNLVTGASDNTIYVYQLQ